MSKLRAFSENISTGSRVSRISSFRSHSSFARTKKPTARFYDWQPRLHGKPVAMYNILGGPSHGSTVSAKRLKELGIKIPAHPKVPTAKTTSLITKALKTISKKSGIKLAAKTIARIVSKISPWLMGVSIATDVLEFLATHKAQVSSELFKVLREERVSLGDREKIREALKAGKFGSAKYAEINPRVPSGDNYHPSVGWY